MTNIIPIFHNRKGRIYFNLYLRHKPLLGKKPVCLNNILFFVVMYISFLITSLGIMEYNYSKIKIVEPVKGMEKIIPTITPIIKKGRSWTGKVSYYSQSGCLGCNKNQITASGEKFDETKMTLAFNKLPMKTMVLITNIDTGISMVAKVNDRGGFEKYNRIADLSKALFNYLGIKTDITNIKIEEIL